MGTFKNWKEYLDHRGSLIDRPGVDHLPTYKGKDPKKPHSGGKPYRVAGEKSPAKAEKGLGSHTVPANKPDKNQRKTKTEEFIDKTKDMSLVEFTSYMISECGCGIQQDESLPMVTAYTTGKFHPHPPEAIRYVAALAKKNPRIMEALLHEMKSQDAFGDMLSSTMDHPETFGTLTDLLGDDEHGPTRSKALVRSMNDKYSKFLDDQGSMFESVAPSYGVEDEDEDEDDEEALPDEEMDAGDEKDPMIGDEDELEDAEEDDGEDDSFLQDAREKEMGPPEEGEEDMDAASMPPPAKPKLKVKKKFAHDHLLDAMSGHDHMRERMKGYN